VAVARNHCIGARTLSRPESARQKDDQADQQNQSDRTAAEDRAAEVKPTATQQQKQEKNDKYCIHDARNHTAAGTQLR
jgi:hypothetical protein